MSAISTDQSRKTDSGVPRIAYLLAGIVFVLGTNEFGIAGLLPDVARDLSVSVPRAGLLVSAYAVAMVIGAPLLTVAGGRLPHRTTLISALLLFAAAQLLAVLTDVYAVVLVSRIVAAAATGAFWAGAAAVVVSATGEQHRARALSVQMAGLTVANVAGVPLGTVVGEHLGWRATFIALGLLALLATVAVLRVLPAGLDTAAEVDMSSEIRSLVSAPLILTLGVIAVFQTGVIACFVYLAPLVTDVAGMPTGLVPVVLVLFGLGSLVGVRAGGWLADLRPRLAVLSGLGTLVVASLALAVGAAVPAVVVVAAAVLGAAAFAGAAALNPQVFIQAAGAPRLAGAVSASAFNVGAALGPWLGGLTVASRWGYRGPSYVAVVLSVVAVAMAVWLMIRFSQRRPVDAST